MCKVEEVRAHLKKGVQRVRRQLFFLHNTLWRGALCKKNLERCFVHEKFGEVLCARKIWRGGEQRIKSKCKVAHKTSSQEIYTQIFANAVDPVFTSVFVFANIVDSAHGGFCRGNVSEAMETLAFTH